MENVFSICIAIVVAIVAISQYDTMEREYKDAKVLSRFRVFAFSLTIVSLLSIFMMISYGTIFCFIFYSLDKFIKVFLMVEVVVLTKSIVNIKEKYISLFVSFICYSTIVLYLIDTIMNTNLSVSLYGVYYAPQASWHKALYFIYYMAYIIALLTLVIYRATSIVKPRDKRCLYMLTALYASSALGFVVEQFIVVYSVTYFPTIILFNLFTVVLLRKILIYQDSISVDEAAFERELDPSRTDVVFILDDQLKVIFQNQRAKVLSKIYEDTYIDRKLSSIFKFSDEVYGQINANPNEIPFGINAEYEKLNRNVNIVVQHKIDPCGEILITVVFVYSMEDTSPTQLTREIPKEISDEQIITNAITVTKDARVLIVDEDPLALNVLGRLLEQYELNVSRANGGEAAIERVRDFVYDIIFVTYEMKKMDGTDLARNIRSLPGEYYRQVPIVFVTGKEINDVYSKFIEVGFNDYLIKPVTHKTLSMVLTRWLWQRFDNEQTLEAEAENALSAQLIEMGYLIEDSILMYEKNNLILLDFCVNGIKHACDKLNLNDISDVSAQLREAIMFEDEELIKMLLERLINAVREATTINA